MKCSKMRGKKSNPHLSRDVPPRRRANKRRGHGTYDNDRPPIVGTIGRESGTVRLRVVHHTDSQTLNDHVHRFTLPKSTPTNGRVTTISFAFTQPSVMAMVSGQETTTVTEFVRFILTHVKVCGRRFAISDVPFEASTRNTSRVTLLSANSVSISNASIPISSRTWSQEETAIEPTVFS